MLGTVDGASGERHDWLKGCRSIVFKGNSTTLNYEGAVVNLKFARARQTRAIVLLSLVEKSL